MRTRILLSPLLLFSILVSVCGQQPGPSPLPTPPRPATAAPTITQPDDDQDVVRITTNLVQVDVVVTKDGKLVTDLTAEDFEILQDGKPQPITNFSYVSNMPVTSLPKIATVTKDKNAPSLPPAVIRPQHPRRTIALIVDDLGMSLESTAFLKTQLRKFLDELPPNDLVAIIRTGGYVGALQQFTNDKRLLRSAIDRLRWNPCSRAGANVFGSMSSNFSLCSQGSLKATLAALQFIIRGMSALPGRKAAILFSDIMPIQHQEPNFAGVESWRDDFTANEVSTGRISDPNSDQVNADPLSHHAGLQKVAELAIRGSVVIYAVDTRGLQYTGLTAADRVSGSLQSVQAPNLVHSARSSMLEVNRVGGDWIATQTGGFLVKNSNSLGLQRVMEDQHGYYLVGFRPHGETFDRNFHRIKARLKRGGFTVRTRVGFYGYTNEEARPKEITVRDQLTKALLSPFAANDLTLKLTTFFVDQPDKGPVLRSFLYLEPRDLSFTEEAEGWRVANFDFSTMIFGDNGRLITQKHQSGGLRMRGEQYQQAQSDGILYSFDVPASVHGPVQFRMVLRDSNSSRIGAAGQFIEIPDLRNGRLALSGIVVRQDATAGASGQPSGNQERLDIIGPARRRFHKGGALVFTYAIYNAARETTTVPQLTTQTRLFRNGKPEFVGEVVPVNLDGQADPRRIVGASALQLDSKMEPGEYIVQIIVTNGSGPKARSASQWIDFEVVK